MFVVHKKGLKKDGRNPTLVTAYGGFNVSLTPTFSRTAYLWMEHGGVYVVANLGVGPAWCEFGKTGTAPACSTKNKTSSTT